jgi:hypothetical protein
MPEPKVFPLPVASELQKRNMGEIGDCGLLERGYRVEQAATSLNKEFSREAAAPTQVAFAR